MTMNGTKTADNLMSMSNDRPDTASNLVEAYSVETATVETVEKEFGTLTHLPGGIA